MTELDLLSVNYQFMSIPMALFVGITVLGLFMAFVSATAISIRANNNLICKIILLFASLSVIGLIGAGLSRPTETLQGTVDQHFTTSFVTKEYGDVVKFSRKTENFIGQLSEPENKFYIISADDDEVILADHLNRSSLYFIKKRTAWRKNIRRVERSKEI